MQRFRKIPHLKKRLFFNAIFMVSFFLVFSVWRQWVKAVPDVEIPVPKLPSPNAYDFYVMAGEAYIKTEPAVDEFIDAKGPVPEEQWKTRYPTSGKEAWLRRNALALGLLRQGFKFPCRIPPIRSSGDERVGHLSGLRTLARLLVVESHAHAERGNWNKAAGSALDTLELGHDISQSGTQINSVVGTACNAFGLRELWKILPHLKASEAKSATSRLISILQPRISCADVLREEKYENQALLLETMRSSDWPGTAVYMADKAGLRGWDEFWQPTVTPCHLIFENYTSYMDSVTAFSEKRYGDKTFTPTLPSDFYNRVRAQSYDRLRWNYARDESGTSLFLVALALRAYRLENGQYPQRLSALVPGYLKRIPPDPYSAGKPMRYKIVGDKYVLYSVGPDGVDNGGRPIENSRYPKEDRRHFRMDVDSPCDFVAGINS